MRSCLRNRHYSLARQRRHGGARVSAACTANAPWLNSDLSLRGFAGHLVKNDLPVLGQNIAYFQVGNVQISERRRAKGGKEKINNWWDSYRQKTDHPQPFKLPKNMQKNGCFSLCKLFNLKTSNATLWCSWHRQTQFSLRNRWAWCHGNQPTQQCMVVMQSFRTGMRISLCITLRGLMQFFLNLRQWQCKFPYLLQNYPNKSFTLSVSPLMVQNILLVQFRFFIDFPLSKDFIRMDTGSTSDSHRQCKREAYLDKIDLAFYLLYRTKFSLVKKFVYFLSKHFVHLFSS